MKRSVKIADLSSFFHITDVYEAVMDTVEDAKQLECLMLDISPDANLDILFKHPEDSRFAEMSLGREKAKGGGVQQYVSNLLKGSSNMTLETIARLENALNIDILRSALTYVCGYTSIQPQGQIPQRT